MRLSTNTSTWHPARWTERTPSYVFQVISGECAKEHCALGAMKIARYGQTVTRARFIAPRNWSDAMGYRLGAHIGSALPSRSCRKP